MSDKKKKHQQQAVPYKLVPPSPAMVQFSQDPSYTVTMVTLALGVTLQRRAAAVLQGLTAATGLTEADRENFVSQAVKLSAVRHASLLQQLEDMKAVAMIILQAINEDALAFANADAETLLRQFPVVMPRNRFAAQELLRGSLTVLAGAPPQACEQLLAGQVEGQRLFVLPAEKSAISKIAETLGQELYDLIVVPDLNALAAVDVGDVGAPEFSRLNDAVNRLNRVLNEHPQVAVFALSRTLPEPTKTTLTEAGHRVITWNSDFGPDVFFDPEDGQKRYDEMVAAVKKQQEAYREAAAQQPVAAPELSEPVLSEDDDTEQTEPQPQPPQESPDDHKPSLILRA